MKRPGDGKSLPRPPYEFDGLILDGFQQEAIAHILQRTTTLVSAPTGTGKSLISDFLVDLETRNGASVIYTGPVKALVGQKFREFTRRFGRESVGMVTGDVSHQPDAPVVVMTTEILRNMLFRRPEALDRISWVIFDEVHYLGHAGRGTVWEEAILLLPGHVRILGLSATVPNARELAEWLETARKEPVALTLSTDRAVPLKHVYFNKAARGVGWEGLLEAYSRRVAPDPDGYDPKAGGSDPGELWPRAVAPPTDETDHLDVLGYIAEQRLFPCLYFVFSRRDAAAKAEQYGRTARVLGQRERESVRVTVKRTLEEFGLSGPQVPELDASVDLWQRGVGVHHAGLLPVVRRICEILLERRILRVVYATETFAVGVNLPVRSVCFDSMEKWDGARFRFLTQQEYFQMAGRAGRRGLDRVGVAVSLVRFSKASRGAPPRWDESALEPIVSQINLGYSTVANLVRRFAPAEIDALFAAALAAHQAGDARAEALTQLEEGFRRTRGTLESLGHIEGGELTAKGRILASLFNNELLVAELIATDFLDAYNEVELAGIAGVLIDDETPAGDRSASVAGSGGGSRRETRGAKGGRRGRASRQSGSSGGFVMDVPRWSADLTLVRERIHRQSGLDLEMNGNEDLRRGAVLSRWCAGASIEEVADRTGVDHGDVVTLCRQGIDLLRQIRAAAGERRALCERITQTLALMERDAVRVRLH